MKNYSVDLTKKWDYENGFYLTCETGRIGKLMNHLEIYKRIVGLEGDVLVFTCEITSSYSHWRKALQM